MEYKIPEFKIPIVEYTLFSSYGTKKLSLNHCKKTKINLYIPKLIHNFKDYQYNPNGDLFVEQGSQYFVCDVNMEIVSNYTNLGKLIQDIYQYPYYIRINQIEVYPYPKDKKILLSKISLRLYAHTSPEDTITESISTSGKSALEGANVPLPQ